ncbi:MAG TPA: hypothetical protein VJQ56_00870, partial [Blastocatellia bacterium]|nr:hypothetical protein [Blastocatellia bacterium]
MRSIQASLIGSGILRRLRIVVLVAVALSASASAQPSAGKLEETALKNLQWRSIGPANMGGRIDDFAVVETNPHIIYAGVATGGVWKTTNNG